MKRNYKKRFKEKIKITLRILVLFVIVKNIGYSEEVLPDKKVGIVIEDEKNQTIQKENINHGAYKEVRGLEIKNSENITVDIDEINTTLKKKTETISGTLFGKGLVIDDKSTVYMSDGLKINVATEELEGNITSLVGVTNEGNLTLGENTKINVVANGNVASNSITYGAYLKGTSLTHFGRGSEINVSATTGLVTGISTNFTGIDDKYGVIIGDNVKIKAEVTNAVSGNNEVKGIFNYSDGGSTVTIGNGLILETEINLSNGATGNSYGIENQNNGKMTIGNGAKITSVLNSENQKNNAYTVYNSGDSIINIGKDSEINVKGSDARQVAAVYNASSELVIEDKSIITAWAENTNFLIGLYNYNGGKMIIGDKVKISSNLESINGTNTAYAIYNLSASTLNIGKDSEISASGKDANQVNVIYNNGASSEVTIEDGGTIAASGENTGTVRGIYNGTQGKMIIGNEVKISSNLKSEGQKNNVYGVHNSASTLNIGKDSGISASGKDANQVHAVYNIGSSSGSAIVTIEDGGTIAALGENAGIVRGIYNGAKGKITIGNEAKLTSYLESADGKNKVYGVYNFSASTLNIGKNFEISAIGKETELVNTVYNFGASSEVTIEDGGSITALGENTGTVRGVYNDSEGKIAIGNEVKITSYLESVNRTNTVFGTQNLRNSTLNIGKNSEINAIGKDVYTVYAVHNSDSKVVIEDGGNITASGENSNFVVGLSNNNNGNIEIKDRGKIVSILNSTGQKDNVFGINNMGNSTVNIGKNSEISALGKDLNQIVAMHNKDLSSITIEDGSTITASGTGTNQIVAAIWNENGNIKLNGGTDISSDGYAVYNESGRASINDEGYSKKIQGDIRVIGTDAVTSILLDTDDSYLEGGSSKGNGGVFNFGLKNNAVWYVPQNSEVTNFDIENGIVDMTQNQKGEIVTGKQILSIDNTKGNGGIYIMDISPEDRDQTGDKTDSIYIEKADAAQKNYIQAGKTSIVGLISHDFSDKEKSAILIGSADKNVTFEGTQLTDTASIYDYVLSLEENIYGETDAKNTWYVTGVEKQEGEVIKNIENAITLSYMSAVSSRSELNSVHKRLSEVHYGASENGTWAGTSGGQIEHNKSSEKFKNEYKALQVGYDKRKETEKRSTFTGIAVHRKDGKTDFKNGDGKNYDIGISLYKSFVMQDNSYANLVVKYSYIKNEHKNYTNDKQEMKTEYNTWSGSISFEYGKKYEKNNWYITPQTQMDYTFVKGADYTMNSGIKVEQKNTNSLIGRAGLYAGYDFERSSHFIKTGILQEFSGDYGARITGVDTKINKKYKGKDTWLEAGIGGYFKVGKTGTTNIYYGIEKTYGNKFERNWEISLGLRIKL